METTDEEREKLIKKDMEELKKWYETVNDKLWNLERKIDTMSEEQVANSCAIQSKLDMLLRKSIAQEKTIRDKTERSTGSRVDFVEPQSKKQESTPLPMINNRKGSCVSKSATKGEVSNSTRIPRESNAHMSVTPDAMTWANTWETMNWTLEAFPTRNAESSDRGGGKTRKTFKKQKEFKEDSNGYIETVVQSVG